jgi:hypothetical protein
MLGRPFFRFVGQRRAGQFGATTIGQITIGQIVFANEPKELMDGSQSA